MAPASLSLTLFEPVVYLRGQSAVGEDARGRRRPINFDAPPSQLRGLVTLTLPKPSRIKAISITLVGKARTDWPEGIGPARLDTSEETTIIKQHVVLFSASASSATNQRIQRRDQAAAPSTEPRRRRAGSIGPGVVGLDDDGVDWAALQGDVSSSSTAPGATSSSPSMPLGTSAAAPANASAAASATMHSSTSPSADRRIVSGEELAPHRKSPALARQIGQVAARAGSAMLPPTLVREINTSKNNHAAVGSRSQSPPVARTNGMRPSFQRSASSGRSSSTSSNGLARPSSVDRERGIGGGGNAFAAALGLGSSGTRSGPSTPAAMPSSRTSPYFYEDPPPRYQQAPERSVADVAAQGQQQRITPPLLAASAPLSTTSSSSSSTSTPLSVSSAEHDGARTAYNDALRGENDEGNHLAGRASQQQQQQKQQHPQSVSAAGPRGRSILHASGRQENRSKSRMSEGPGVRFDPEAIAAALCGNENSSQTDSGTPAPTSFSPPTSSTTSSAALPSSASSSRRTSMDFARSLASPLTGASPPRVDKGKGKAKTNPATSASPPPSTSSASTSTTPTTSSPSTSKSKKGGIKGLLGALLREEGEKDRGSSVPRDAVSSGGSSNAGGEGGSAGSEFQSSSTLDHDGAEWKEFKKGTYTYPISIPLPSNLPPTLHADFGSNTYMLKAHVHRAGALTANLTTEREVTLIYAPDEDSPEETEAIVVERSWDDALGYIVIVGGKSFPVASKMTVWLKFVPTEKIRIHRIMATLEERTAYFARGRRVARHEVPRRWNLLKLLSPQAHAHQPLLPIDSSDPDALNNSALSTYAQHAADLYTQAADVDGKELIASLADPIGPWELAADLEIPSCSDTRINISTNHAKSNIAVHHLIKLAIRVEKGGVSDSAPPAASAAGSNSANRKLYDILIEAPITIRHSHTSHAWLNLPDYWSVRDGDELTPSAIQDTPARPPSSSNAAISSGSSSNNGPSQAAKRATAPSLTAMRMPSNSNSNTTGASSSANAPAASASPPPHSAVNASSSSAPLPLPPGVGARHLQGSRPASAAAARELSRRWLALSAGGGSVGAPSAASGSNLDSGASSGIMSSYLNSNVRVDPTGGPSHLPSSFLTSSSSGGAIVTVEEPPTYWQIDRARGSTDLDDDAREAVLAK